MRNPVRWYIDAARRWGPLGVSLFALFIVVFVAVAYFSAPHVEDELDGGPPIHEVDEDLAMGDGLPAKGEGASPSTLFPRFTSTRSEVVWKPSVHWSSRGNNDIQAIVVHVAAGRPDQCDGTANYLAKNDRLVSAHFMICEDKIYQQVEIGDAAHHAGIWGARLNEHNNPIIDSWWRAGLNPNSVTVGIETSLTFGYHIDNEQGMKENLIETLVWLTEELDLPPDRTHIIGHYEIDDVNRPSDPVCCMDLDAIVAEVARRVHGGTGIDPAPACVTEGYDPCTGRWMQLDGWSYAPGTQWWYDPLERAYWSACNADGYRWSFIEQAYAAPGGWRYFPETDLHATAPAC